MAGLKQRESSPFCGFNFSKWYHAIRLTPSAAAKAVLFLMIMVMLNREKFCLWSKQVLEIFH
jgi:hypothetical protein